MVFKNCRAFWRQRRLELCVAIFARERGQVRGIARRKAAERHEDFKLWTSQLCEPGNSAKIGLRKTTVAMGPSKVQIILEELAERREGDRNLSLHSGSQSKTSRL